MASVDEVQQANEAVWDRRVREGENAHTRPVSSDEVDAARRGDVRLHLGTPKRIPQGWFPELRGCEVLCLAAGGGQQGPLLAAAGATVTVFDASAEQLAQDKRVAERDGLALETVQGDMRDLSRFADESFDLIVHPVANCFIPDVNPVWRECFRVLRPRGLLLSAFVNPILYALGDSGSSLEHAIPYSDLERLNADERERHLSEGGALEFGHTLEDLIGGQLAAGFVITGFYEDRFPGQVVDAFLPSLLATRASKQR